jgi:hypothetical protein
MDAFKQRRHHARYAVVMMGQLYTSLSRVLVRLSRDDATHSRHLDVRIDVVTAFLERHYDDHVLLLRIDTSRCSQLRDLRFYFQWACFSSSPAHAPTVNPSA